MKILPKEQILKEQEINNLKNGSTFGALSEEAIVFLISQGNLIKLEEKETLFRKGDKGNCFYIVIDGSIEFIPSSDNKFKKLFSFGDQLGFVAMIALRNRLGEARSVNSAIVLQVSDSAFFQMHEEMPDNFGILLLNLSREMARQIADVAEGSQPS